MPIPLASQSGSFFFENSLLFNQPNISRADIHYVLENGARGAARPTQPVTLHITIIIIPPNPYISPPSMPIEDVNSPAEDATIPGHIQLPSPEHILPLSHHQPIEAGNNKPQEMSTTGAKKPRLALKGADQAVKQMDLSNTWKGAVGRIKWVMDTLRPVAEVRVIPCDLMSLLVAELTSTFSFSHPQRWHTVYFRQSPRHVHLCHFPNETLMLYSSGLQTLLEQYQHDSNVKTLLRAIHDAFDFTHHEDILFIKSIKPQSKQAQILTLMLQDVCSCSDFIQSYAKYPEFCTSS